MEFRNDNGALVFKRAGETVRIEAWGENSLRVRATMLPEFTGHDWALSEKPSVRPALTPLCPPICVRFWSTGCVR